MPYCPNCGGQTKAEHYYCGQCAQPLTDEVDDESDEIPPSGTAVSQQGFLSGRSLQYLNQVLEGEAELDPDSPGYSNLSRDVGAALADFAKVATVADVNLLELIADRAEEGASFDSDPEDLTRQQQRNQLMWIGLYRLPELFDRSFGTEWEDEMKDNIQKLAEKAEELVEDDSR